MKLVKKISTSTRHGIPSISFARSGVITITSSFTESIGPDAWIGKKLGIYQDEDSKKDWYIKLENEGLALRAIKGGKLKAQSSSISRDFHNTFEATKSAKCLLSTKEMEGGYYAIITKSIIKS